MNSLSSATVKQYAVVFALNLNCLNLGLGTAWPSPVIVKLSNDTQNILARPLELDETSWIVSITYLTMTAGFITASFLADSLGRKRSVLLSRVTKLLAALLFLFASEVWMLVLGRSIEGVSDGLMLGIIPIYASELASKEIRGALGTMLQILSSFGVVIMLCVGPFISYFHLNLMYTICIVFLSIPTMFLPDSPYFLYSKGQHEETRKVLIFLRSSEITANEELKEYTANNRDQKVSLIQTFRDKMFLKSLGTATFTAVLTYISGFNSVSSYLQTILIQTRTEIKSEIASAIIGVIQIVASFTALLTTDRFGRKPILVLSLAGMTLGMIGLGVFFKLREFDIEVSGFLNFLPLLSLMIVVYCFSAGCGSLMWVLTAELFDDRSRGVGFSTTMVISVPALFLSVRYFPVLTTSIGAAATFWIYAGLCLLLAFYIWFCVPETKGKSFAEIQKAMGGNK